MNTSHYPSLELCKKLTVIGFPTTFQHISDSGGTVIGSGEIPKGLYVSPSVMEMLDIMPDHIGNPEDEGKGWDYAYILTVDKRVADMGYDVAYIRMNEKPFTLNHIKLKTLPDALAEMILWLHENKYITFK